MTTDRAERGMNETLRDFTVWNVTLTEDEVLRLFKGEDPRTIRPDAIVEYRPGVHWEMAAAR